MQESVEKAHAACALSRSAAPYGSRPPGIGIAAPRGTSTDYLAHVLNQPVATDATSWTRDVQVARCFGDVILVIDEDDVRDRIVDPHPLPGRYPYEQEVLVRGIVRGATVTT